LITLLATYSRWFLDHGFFYPEDGGDTFSRNVGSLKIYTAPHPRNRNSSVTAVKNLKFYMIILMFGGEEYNCKHAQVTQAVI
jgi:hypothetical protein